MVMFAGTGSGIGSRMLNKADTILTSWNIHSFSLWHTPTHPLRLISNVISTLGYVPVRPSRIVHYVGPTLLFSSIAAFNLFIHQDTYCLLCAESMMKVKDTLVNKTNKN